ncbi:carboxymuconolactone decarboxylase family protein [Nocardioides sp. BYT-33-1]|uniref:carboxymuconolactone decarboxylase family protein n=1 Tax=Nocardioides sp. BYT-33-1 TaxID=3416952 RepID=UPI003F53AB84
MARGSRRSTLGSRPARVIGLRVGSSYIPGCTEVPSTCSGSAGRRALRHPRPVSYDRVARASHEGAWRASIGKDGSTITRTRGRKLSPGELDAGQVALYDEIAHGPRATQGASPRILDADGCLEGPFNAFLLQPRLGHALQALGAALRYRTDMPDRWREVAILVVAAREDAEVERYFHEPVARALGLTDEQLAGLRRGDHSVLDAEDALVAGATTELLDDGDLGDATYAALLAWGGEALVLELTSVIGYYTMLAVQLRVFGVAPPDPPAPTP